ncbi:MAG TPA: GNAT family N-acetyltransferase [Candidatus Cybelea sp.]
MRIKRLGPGEERELEKLHRCFDRGVIAEAAIRFLNSGNHHILVGYDGESAVGFVSGVETTHPDKGTEMFLYELAVDEGFRGRGYGVALVRKLVEVARDRGCYGMWVLSDECNAAGLATYASAGAMRASSVVELCWKFDPRA